MIYDLSNITFSYGKRKVLDIDKLLIEEGKIYVLCGANGSGKTTLLKILNGLLKPDSGILKYNDYNIDGKDYTPLRQSTVYVHQTPVLLSGTVEKNIAFGMKLRKKEKKCIAKTIADVLEVVGLSGFEERKSNNLSGGELRRIAIARALAINPKVLLLDEPTAHIDRTSLVKINDTLKEIKEKYDTTVILSSHDDCFNETIADQIICIEQGKVVKS